MSSFCSSVMDKIQHHDILDLTRLNCKIQCQNQHQSTTVRGMPHIHIYSSHHINTYTIHKSEHIPPSYMYSLLLTLCSQHIFEVCDKICGEHILLLYQLRVYQPNDDFIKSYSHSNIQPLCCLAMASYLLIWSTFAVDFKICNNQFSP